MVAETEESKNREELTNEMVLKEAQEKLNELKQSFENLKDKVSDEKTNKEKGKLKERAKKLDNVNKLIKKSKLDQTDKKIFKNTINSLQDKVKDININNEELKKEFDKVTELIDSLIQKELKELKNLKDEIEKSHTQNPSTQNSNISERPEEVKKEIENSSKKIPKLIEDAKDDKSWFVRNVIARLLERANS